jgi:uncharacterized protein (UPF0248 family)
MSNYKTRLAKEINLNVEQWEVGLAEIHYPVSWHNVRDGMFVLRKLVESKWEYVKGRVPDNRYDSVEKLVKVLQREIDEILGDQSRKIALSYTETRHIKLYLAENYELTLAPSLSKVLGFDEATCVFGHPQGDLTFPVDFAPSRVFGTKYKFLDESDLECEYNHRKSQDSVRSTFVADVNRGIKNLFIHCNIIESQLVGDLYVPLLRTIAVRGKTNEVVSESFANIHYVRIERSTFQEIELHITDETGANVTFEDGRVIVKLHFKRK